MSEQPPAGPEKESPTAHGKFSINEDWLATVVGLALVGLVLVGAIPVGLVP